MVDKIVKVLYMDGLMNIETLNCLMASSGMALRELLIWEMAL